MCLGVIFVYPLYTGRGKTRSMVRPKRAELNCRPAPSYGLAYAVRDRKTRCKRGVDPRGNAHNNAKAGTGLGAVQASVLPHLLRLPKAHLTQHAQRRDGACGLGRMGVFAPRGERACATSRPLGTSSRPYCCMARPMDVRTMHDIHALLHNG